jgi:hypothetical protein
LYQIRQPLLALSSGFPDTQAIRIPNWRRPARKVSAVTSAAGFPVGVGLGIVGPQAVRASVVMMPIRLRHMLNCSVLEDGIRSVF